MTIPVEDVVAIVLERQHKKPELLHVKVESFFSPDLQNAPHLPVQVDAVDKRNSNYTLGVLGSLFSFIEMFGRIFRLKIIKLTNRSFTAHLTTKTF